MKKERRILLAFVMLLVVALVAGCANQPAATQPAANQPAATQPAANQPAASTPAKYGLFMSHMTNAFTVELSDAVKAKAKELGVDLTVYDGGNDAAKQLSQMETAINEGITAIIIEPVSVDGIIPGVEQAKKAGIPVITVNQNISKPELVNSFVGVSHVQGGELEMQAAADALGGKGNIVILDGPMGSDAQIGRDQGYKNILAKYPDIKILYQQTANWKTDEALKLVENWLQTGTQIDAIVSENDAMAVGAEKAVEDAQMLDKIKIFGLDATPDALALVKDGKMTATVSQSTTEQGTKAMEAAYNIVNGKQVEPTITVQHTLINKDNVDQFIK